MTRRYVPAPGGTGAGQRSWSPAARAAAVAVFYSALAVAATWPVAIAGAAHVPSDLGDPVMSIALMHWNFTVTPLTGRWWDGVGFFPLGDTVAWSDPRLGVSLLAYPVAWLTGSTVAAYGAAFVLSFALCGIAMHALVYSVTRSHASALVAGCAYGFSPVRVAHLSHIELLATYWMPVGLAAMHRYARNGSARALALACAAFALQGVFGTSSLPYFAVLCGAWIAWLAFGGAARRAAALAAGLGAAGAGLGWLLHPYVEAHRAVALHRGVDEIQAFSADLTGLWNGAPALRAWPWHDAANAEGFLYLGFTAAVLVCTGALFADTGEDAPWQRRARRLLLAVGAAAAVLVTAAAMGLTFDLRFAGVRVSLTSFPKPLSIAAFAIGLACLFHPRVVAAVRRRSIAGFYALSTALAVCLALGPAPTAFGAPFLYKAPYAGLMVLPIFSGTLRTPGRFGLVAALALAAAAGLAWHRLSRAWRPQIRWALTATVAVAIVAEGWAAPLTVLPAPRAFAWPARCRDVPRFELPFGSVASDAAAQYRAALAGVRSVNGASGYVPPHLTALAAAVGRADADALFALAEYGPICIAIDSADENARWLAPWLSSVPGIESIREQPPGDGPIPSARSFVLLRRRSPLVPAPIAGAALPIARIVPTTGALEGGELRDGVPSTGWVTPEYQTPGDALEVTLGCLADVARVSLSQGAFAAGFPRALAIELGGGDGRWRTAWRGPLAGAAVRAGLANPALPMLAILVPAKGVRAVRLHADAEAPARWAVAELSIEGTCVR